MPKFSETLIKSYFDQHSFVKSDIESFNRFLEKEMQNVIEENKEIEPTIIPPNIDSFKIRLDKVWVKHPEIIEADGSRRAIYPVEARLRKISYAAPIFLEVSAHINDVQRESFTTQIGNLPIMLRSKNCLLNNLSRDELIEKGEDPDDPGGYFIINGTEKVVMAVEDLASNVLLVGKETTGVSEFSGRIFSEQGSFKIPHTIERLKDGVFYISFMRVKRVPVILLLKALGLVRDDEIMQAFSRKKQYDEIIVNMLEYASVKTDEDALDMIAKHIGITQAKEIRLERITEIIDRYFLPNIGTTKDSRAAKAHNLCKMLKKFIAVSSGEVRTDDKDHYMNKKLKMSGDLLADLFRVNLRVLIDDMLYNFQRIVKRGKFPSIKVIIREKLMTSRIYSAMATGNWVGGRKGISQRTQRVNFLDMLSHLQRVISPLSTSQENFEARELHATHLGRLCPSETPEGTNIGLRKNLALLARISSDANEEEIMKSLKNAGLKPIQRS